MIDLAALNGPREAGTSGGQATTYMGGDGVAERICSYPRCEEPHLARGWCRKHYYRWYYHGTAEDPRLTPEQRFWPFVNKTEGCWLWTAAQKSGYGLFSVAGRQVGAHRFAYKLLVGPIPAGLQLDHVKANGCTSTLCVKAIADDHGPAHLEPVTGRENLLRGDTFQAHNAAKTHCPQGHPYDEANTIHRGGRRLCRECIRQRKRRSR